MAYVYGLGLMIMARRPYEKRDLMIFAALLRRNSSPSAARTCGKRIVCKEEGAFTGACPQRFA